MSEPSRKEPYIVRRPGGDIDRKRIFAAPGVVVVLAGLTVVAYLLTAFAPPSVTRVIGALAVLSPRQFLAGASANGGLALMLSPLIGHMFLHANLQHLLINMLMFLAFGSPIARRMGAEGALKSAGAFFGAFMFIVFYFLCGAVGALVFIFTHVKDITPLVGASGGVFGLFGGVVRFAFNRTTLLGSGYAKFSPLTSRPVMIWSAFVLIMNLPVTAALLGMVFGGASIAWEAHLGGYFFGLLTYPFFERLARGGKRR